MSVKSLGRLEKVELREAWMSESGDFTPWLAQVDNLALLGETIGMDLELESREKDVGPFRADILCKETISGHWVLIENPLEKTDHMHLGQLLTYAAGLKAAKVVWIAYKFTDEHRAALDWLNEITDEHFNFFGLEVELWRIGDSPIAPKFNIICQPNDWSRDVRHGAAETEAISAHKQLQLKFWTAFREYMESKDSVVRCQKPSSQNWMSHAVGRSGMHLNSIASLWNTDTGAKGPQIRAQLYLDGPQAKQDFAELEKQKARIEQALGFPLKWHSTESKNACRFFTVQDADFLDESQWPQHFEWLRQKLEAMYRVLKPIVKELRPAPGDSREGVS